MILPRFERGVRSERSPIDAGAYRARCRPGCPRYRELLAFATLAAPQLLSPRAVCGQPQMTCELSSTLTKPNTSVVLTVFLNNASNVRAYQTRIGITRTSGTGDVTVNCPGGVVINQTRSDYLFFGIPNTFPVVDCPTRTAASALLSGGVSTGGVPKYLAHYLLTVSPDATGHSTFDVALLPSPASDLADPSGSAIPFTVGPVCTLIIQPPTLEFVTDTCGSCVRAPGTVRVNLVVRDLSEPINGVQVLFQYSSAVLSLTSVTPGDGAGSPWDAGQVIAVQDNAGECSAAIVLNGSQSAADAVVASFHFATGSPGTTNVAFRPGSEPFFTKLTIASNSQVRIPDEEDSDPIIVGTRSKGDINGDGQRNGDDVQDFVRVLFNPIAAAPDERCAADMTGDGNVLPPADVDLFVNCLLTGNCVCP